MKLYVFRCRTRPRMYGATLYETASNLPTGQCPGGWKFFERVDLSAHGNLRFAVDKTVLRRQVQQHGWYVWDESPKDLRKTETEQVRVPIASAASAVLPSRPTLAASSATPFSITPAPQSERRSVVIPGMKPEPAPPVGAQVEEPPPPMARESMPESSENASGPLMGEVPQAERRGRNVDATPARHHAVWFDIPVRDMDRAVRFYSAVLGIRLKKDQAGPGAAIALLPHAEGYIGGCLVQNIDSRPAEGGPLLYLNAHNRLNEALNAVEAFGGRILTGKHSIEPFGFRAIVVDCEGNRIALHSS